VDVFYLKNAEQSAADSHTRVSCRKEIFGPWGFWATVGFGLLVILAYFIGQVLVENIFAVNNSISHPGQSISQLTNILSSGNALATTIFVSTVIGMVLTILLCVTTPIF